MKGIDKTKEQLISELTEMRQRVDVLETSESEWRQAEKELQGNYENFRAIFENLNNVIIRLDKYGKIVEVNGRLKSMFGYEPDEVIGKNFTNFNLFSIQELPKMVKLFADGIRGKVTRFTEVGIRRKDGSTFFSEISTGLARRNNKIEGMIAVVRDITERKRAEEALKDSEEKFSRAFHSNPHPMSVVTLKEGRYLDVNDSYVQTFGFSREELLGRTTVEMGIVKNDRARRKILQSLKERQAIKNLEVEFHTRSGRKVDGLLSGDKMEIGGQTCLLSVLTDITERKRVEEALRESEERFSQLYNESPVGYHESDSEGRIIQVNQTELDMLGYTAEEMLGRHVWDFRVETDTSRQAFAAKMAGTMPPGRAFERTYRRKDGTTFPALLEGRYVKDESGQIIGLRSTIQDITEHKRMERELQERNEQLDAQNGELQSQTEELMAQQQEVMYKTKELEEANVHLQEVDRLKSIFLASMSHELRTPLNSIIGFTSLILQGMVGEINEEQKNQLTYVNSSANHLLSLINDILDISKIEAGKVEFELEEFRLGDVATEVVGTFSATAKLKGIRLLMDISEDTKLFSDKRRLKQVLMNLVSNAIKFTDRGSVKVTSRIPADDNLEISVIDTGIGIKKEDIGKLFAPFQQIDDSLTKKHAGTGLGLYISRKIGTLLGGDISVKSEYGRGSEFTFTLPMHYVKEQRNAQSTSSG